MRFYWQSVRDRISIPIDKYSIFHLPKKLPQGASIDWDVVIVDATEMPVERPKKQKTYYSGKKKRYTLKMQVMIHYLTGHIVSSCFAKGRFMISSC